MESMSSPVSNNSITLNLKGNHAPRVTPHIEHAAIQNPDHTWKRHSSTIATRTTVEWTADVVRPHIASEMNCQL